MNNWVFSQKIHYTILSYFSYVIFLFERFRLIHRFRHFEMIKMAKLTKRYQDAKKDLVKKKEKEMRGIMIE